MKALRLQGQNLLRRRVAALLSTTRDATGAAALPATSAAAAKVKNKAGESKYFDSILLPQTTFEQRANSKVKEPGIQQWWRDNQIYEKLRQTNAGDPFTLHDGPPYANGDLHIGHALNKILKDFVNRYMILRGRKVTFVPGWDCHGLPIELKVLQGMKQKEREGLDPIGLRRKAAEFAQATIHKQSAAFQRYGVWGDWSQPYLTMQREYEAAQIRVFGEMYLRGNIYRGKKPVHWSPSTRTALAEAELEYADKHVSRSIYVAFPVTSLSQPLAQLAQNHNKGVHVVVWTTTPWTIPANLAVAVNEELEYCLVSHPRLLDGAPLLVARDLATAVVAKLLGSEDGLAECTISRGLPGRELSGTQYRHPLYGRVSEVVVGGDYITADNGTGLVHTAPGHGQEDYAVGLRLGLPLLSPVDDAGAFTAEAGAPFAGLPVLTTGTDAVIRALADTGALLKEEAYTHKYPYDWRSKKPTIFRATEQWFASVAAFREDALRAIDETRWVPPKGRNRIAAMTAGRSDWCISRQRSWGVPIPVFYHKASRQPLLTAETLRHVEDVFRTHGSEAWWTLSVADLLPPDLRAESAQYDRGLDTMDVWFDSGTSWAGVLQARGLACPADLYLEGSDQARGWFQSSLLTSVAVHGVAPYRTVLTHGFVLDQSGAKMSKSLGNVLDPHIIIEGGGGGGPAKEQPAYGADTLRMWVSSVEYANDVCIGPRILQQAAESYRKLRNTLRFLLGSLADFRPAQHAVPYARLADVDRFVLGELAALVAEAEGGYDSYQFYKVSHALVKFASDLSSFYLDVSKDRLYVSASESPRRRSCQTVLQAVLEQMAVLLAPIAPHLAEEVWQHLPYPKPELSVFEKGWVPLSQRHPAHEAERWQTLIAVRGDVNKCVERARLAKLVGASMECAVFLHAEDAATRALLQGLEGDAQLLAAPQRSNAIDELRFLFMTSQVHVCDAQQDVLAACPDHVLMPADAQSGVTVGVTTARGSKCERCWYYCSSVGSHPQHADLCDRCAHVVHPVA